MTEDRAALTGLLARTFLFRDVPEAAEAVKGPEPVEAEYRGGAGTAAPAVGEAVPGSGGRAEQIDITRY